MDLLLLPLDAARGTAGTHLSECSPQTTAAFQNYFTTSLHYSSALQEIKQR